MMSRVGLTGSRAVERWQGPGCTRMAIVSRWRRAWVAAVILAVAPMATASASIPVGLRLVLVSPDAHDQALNRGFLAMLIEYHAFYLAEQAPLTSDFARCTSLTERLESCVRDALKPSPNDQENPPVVIIATSEPDNKFRWQCFGVGMEAYVAAKQDVRLDLMRAMFTHPEEKFKWRREAIDCIMAAASEAEGRVRITRE